MRRIFLFAPLMASAVGYQVAPVARYKKTTSAISHQRTSRQRYLLDNRGPKDRSPTRRFGGEPEKSPDTEQLEQWYKEMAEGRKIMTMVGYRVTALIYMFLSLFLIASSAWKSLASLPLTCYVVAGPMMASGVSYVLEGAAVNERFFSDTYKRLNIYLGFYGFMWLVASFFARETKSRVLLNPLVITASFAVCVNCYKAWTYGVKGWIKDPNISRPKDLVRGAKEALKVFFRLTNLNGAVYLGATAMVGTLQFTKLAELLTMVRDSSTTGAILAKSIFRYSMLFLLTGVMFTLKDAGDRDRLRSISFIELNTIAAYVLGVMGVYFCQVQKSFYLGVASTFFAFFSATNGYLNAKDNERR